MYEDVKKICGSVSVHVAYGDVSKGKSNAVKAAIAACCNLGRGYLTYLSESLAREFIGNGLPFAYDDPTNAFVLRQLLINAFGGASMGTHVSHSSARCTPLVTANTFVIDELSSAETRYYNYYSQLDTAFIKIINNPYRYIARVILVPFMFDASELQIGQLESILTGAPAAFPYLLSIGNQVVQRCTELYQIREKIISCIPNIDSRLATQYSLSVLCCNLVRFYIKNYYVIIATDMCIIIDYYKF